MLKDDRTVKSYSESFKLKLLSELSDGKYSKNEIRRVYGVSLGSLDYWIKKYRRFDLLNQRLKIETMDELDKLKKLEEENKKLKELLIKKEVDGLMNEGYLEYAAKQLGYKSVEELKKAKALALMSTAIKVQDQKICSVGKLCHMLGLTRDAYYKQRTRMQRSEQVDAKILSLVLERRKQLPREGGKKLYRAILPELELLGIQDMLRKQAYLRKIYTTIRDYIYL